MEKFDELYKIRHSLSHILAQAVQQTFGVDTKLGVWPAIENGFYYDMLFAKPVSEDDFKSLEEAMKKIISQDQKFWHIDCDEATARKINNFLNQPLKNELIDGFVAGGETKFSFFYNYIDPRSSSRLAENQQYYEYYQNLNNFLAQNFEGFEDKFVTFIDMCQGWHVESTKSIQPGSYKLAKLAWAYRKWDENNIQLTRIYGYAFEEKSQLQEYITQLEKLKKEIIEFCERRWNFLQFHRLFEQVLCFCNQTEWLSEKLWKIIFGNFIKTNDIKEFGLHI